MKHLLTVFIDGLKPESLEHMPFVNSLSSKRRIRTELGYSSTCYASMFSGVHPNKHLRWFFWKYSPETSPCKWVRKFKIDKLPHKLYYYLCATIKHLRTFVNNYDICSPIVIIMDMLSPPGSYTPPIYNIAIKTVQVLCYLLHNVLAINIIHNNWTIVNIISSDSILPSPHCTFCVISDKYLDSCCPPRTNPGIIS